MSTLSDAQLHYLRDVLGIQGVILSSEALAHAEARAPIPPPVRVSGAEHGAKLLILASASDGFPLEGEAGELAQKMIQAMKIPASDIQVVEWSQSDSQAVPMEVLRIWGDFVGVALAFGEEAGNALAGASARSGEWIRSATNRTMVTDSPARLLAEPARKKNAWAHLQMVMKELA